MGVGAAVGVGVVMGVGTVQVIVPSLSSKHEACSWQGFCRRLPQLRSGRQPFF